MATSYIKGALGAFSRAFPTQYNKRTLTITGSNGTDQVYFIYGGTTQKNVIMAIIEVWNGGTFVKNLGNQEISVTDHVSNTITVSIPTNYFRGVISSHAKFDAEFST